MLQAASFPVSFSFALLSTVLILMYFTCYSMDGSYLPQPSMFKITEYKKKILFSVPLRTNTSKDLWCNFFFACLISWNAQIDLPGCPSKSTQRAHWHLHQTIQDSSWMLDRKTQNESFTVRTGEIAQKLNQTVHSGSQWSFCQGVTRSKLTLGNSENGHKSWERAVKIWQVFGEVFISLSIVILQIL